MTKKKEKVLVAMSGGVDSSIAAFLLQKQGYDVTGIFLHFWKDSSSSIKNVENKCCSAKALMDARRVCQKIRIPLYTFNFSDIFKKEVVDYFLNKYKQGLTPNPCIPCNKLVKLGLLIKRARKLGFDYVATGHYVKNKKLKIKNKKYFFKLYRGKDRDKDQSYFLYNLTQEQLRHVLFPLGDYTKDEVRKLAKKFKLLVHDKKESQEICFIPEKSHNDFLKRYLKLKSGKIKTLDNKIIGQHNGLPLYTIGQRKGVEIGGTGPYYVARRDYRANILYVVEDKDNPVLYGDKLIAKEVNWISGIEPIFPLKCQAVIRYRHKPAECYLIPQPFLLNRRKGEAKKQTGAYKVKFKKPQRAVTPGQSVVFYGLKCYACGSPATNGAHANECYACGSPATNGAHANYNNEDEILGGGIIK